MCLFFTICMYVIPAFWNINRRYKVIFAIDTVTHLRSIYLTILFSLTAFFFLFFLLFNVHSVVPSFYIIIRYILPIGLSLYSYSHVHLWRINSTRFWTDTNTYTNYSQVIIHLLYLFSIRPHYNKYTIRKVIVTNNLSDHDTYSIEKNDDALDWAPQLLRLKWYT